MQVEGIPTAHQLQRLCAPIELGDFTTLPCKVARVGAPEWLWERQPPIRTRAALPTSWLSLTLSEGKNRQVRRMTAHVGLPTLRLVRIAIGGFSLASNPLWPGEHCEVPVEAVPD